MMVREGLIRWSYLSGLVVASDKNPVQTAWADSCDQTGQGYPPLQLALGAQVMLLGLGLAPAVSWRAPSSGRLSPRSTRLAVGSSRLTSAFSEVSVRINASLSLQPQ